MPESSKNYLSLLYLASPTLPIGSFAYSQGLESAIEAGFVKNKESLEKWCLDTLTLGLTKLDGPLLLRMFQAIKSGDQADYCHWNDIVFACRETHELVSEETNLGASLSRLLRTQEALSSALSSALPNQVVVPETPSLLAAFAMSAIALDLDEEMMLISFFWAWLENQIAVACKAVPIGQSDGQAILLSLRNVIATLVSGCEAASEPFVGSSLPGQAMLSALHETQYSRLFRS